MASLKPLLNTIQIISLIQTPTIKLRPQRRPWFIVCLMVVNITGPTEKIKSKLMAKPFNKASIMH